MRYFSLHFLTLSCLFSTLCATIITPKGELKRNGTTTQSLVTHFDAIYQFGDSLADTGNRIRQADGQGSAFSMLPYGQTYFHRPTGRCSDGLLMVDYFAMYFNLPLLKPYLAKGSNFTNGANFAVVGATALDTSALALYNVSTQTQSSLSKQLDWFKSLLHSTFKTRKEIRAHLKKSLVIMGEIGGNEYNFAFFQDRTMKQVYKLVPVVIQTIKKAVQEVIDLGARNIIVPGNFPIGCVPLYLVRFQTKDASKYDKLQCLREYNVFSKYHNKILLETLQDLQQKNPNVIIAYGDYYTALTWVISHASSLGFEEDGSKKACCGIGNNPYNFDLTRSCGSPGVPVCEDPSKTVSWDGIHLTQEGNKNVARFLLKQFLPKFKKHRHP